ncbi:MAG: hypothetical protein ABI637_01790 [Gemmatimonadota bacterium]
MSFRPRYRAALIALSSFVALAGASSPAFAGPPWISIELPANPLDATTRDAFLIVHTYHHATVVNFALTGRAIGMVDGKRQSIDLAFTRTSIAGAYALRRNWPTQGTWVLAINTGVEGGPTALVGIGADGEVRSVKVPRQAGQAWGRPATDRDIDAALQSLAASDTASGKSLAGLAVLLPLGIGAAFARRRRAA